MQVVEDPFVVPLNVLANEFNFGRSVDALERTVKYRLGRAIMHHAERVTYRKRIR